MSTTTGEVKTQTPGPPPHLPLPASALPQISPSTFLFSHLIADPATRPGGRTPSQTRPISCNVGSLSNANGSALIRLGGTSVVCGVRAEVLDVRDIADYRVTKTDGVRGIKRKRVGRDDGVSSISQDGAGDDEDDDDSETQSYALLVPNIELQTGASPLPAYQPSSGAPSSLAQSLTQRLLSTLYSTRLVHSSDLRIYGAVLGTEDDEESDNEEQILKGYWTLYIDVLVLSHDGAIFDAALMAMVAALKNTMIPRAWFDADRGQIVCSPKMGESTQLKFRGRSPVALSWKVFTAESQGKRKGSEKKKLILLEPDALEEDSGACNEGGTILVDRVSRDEEGSPRVSKLEKNGGGVMRSEDVKEIVRMAGDRWREWDGVLTEAIS